MNYKERMRLEMTKEEAVNWIINLSADIGKSQHQDLWHYEQALAEIKDMLEAEPERKIGKWIDGRPYVNSRWKVCSVCKHTANTPSGGDNYCSYCGSWMED
jgi:hypothetical protein